MFTGGVSESGIGVVTPRMQSLKEAEAGGVRLANSKGATSLAQLRQMPWRNFVIDPRDPSTLGFKRDMVQYGPIIDGWYLPFTPAEA